MSSSSCSFLTSDRFLKRQVRWSGIERLLLNHEKMLGFLASRGEEYNLGPETRLDCSELVCNRVLLEYKRDRESFWHRHWKGDGECPLVSVSNGVIYLLISYYNESKECLEVVETSPDLPPYLHFKITGLARRFNPEPVLRQDTFSSIQFSSVQFRSVLQSCPTLYDPMNCSTPGLPFHYQLPEFTQTHVHRVRDAIQPSHPRSSPFLPAPNPSQHQSLFQWVNCSHEVSKVLELQL